MSSPNPTLSNGQNPRVRINGIYDDYRKAFMNHLYYDCRVDSLKKLSLSYEIVLAVGTSGTVAAWYVWQTPLGNLAWPIFAGVVALLSILKPLLKIPEKIASLTKLHTGYKELYYDLDGLRREMENNGGLTPLVLSAAAEAQQRYKKLALTDERPEQKLLKQSFNQVNQQTQPFDGWYEKYIPA